MQETSLMEAFKLVLQNYGLLGLMVLFGLYQFDKIIKNFMKQIEISNASHQARDAQFSQMVKESRQIEIQREDKFLGGLKEVSNALQAIAISKESLARVTSEGFERIEEVQSEVLEYVRRRAN